MSSSATKPTLISVPFANSGTKNVIPVPSQVSTDPGLASYTTGFPPATMTPKASGGIPPYGADMNGALNAITQWLRYINAGGILTYNTDFATAIGGYPLYARVVSSDGTKVWVNSVEGNTTNPDSGGAGWAAFLNADIITANQLTVGGVAFNNLAYRQFQKYDYTQAWIGKTGAFGIATTSDAWIEVNAIWTFVASGTAATMPGSPVAGTDYALWVKTGGVLEVTNSFTSPPVTGSRLVGGFHYALGGNSTGASGGDSTPAINAYSAWDLKWRPNCDDVRGQTLVGGGFWADIYITGVDHIANGTSKYNVTIADGSNPPKIPIAFGGNGSTAYSSYNWWEAAEVLLSHGKRLPTYMECCALAYGVTEGTSRSSDPVTTGLDAARTSKWGAMQATGNMYIWGADLGGPYAVAGWVATPGARGSTYNLPNAVGFGGLSLIHI